MSFELLDQQAIEEIFAQISGIDEDTYNHNDNTVVYQNDNTVVYHNDNTVVYHNDNTVVYHNDGIENQNGKIEHQMEPVGPQKMNKLPDEILKRFHCEPGKLLIAGNVDWNVTGKTVKRNELNVFHRLTDEMYRAVVSGSSSAHSLLINMDYKVLSFGRNKRGQLGHKELRAYNKPKLIKGLNEVNVVQAACGRNHSLFLTDTGAVYACGDNSNGQVGIGKRITAFFTIPTLIDYDGPPIVKVGCGGEFSVLLDIDGNLHTFGLPEFGQLGHNTDGKYFITSDKLAFDAQYLPKRIVSFIEKSKTGHSTPVANVKIIDFACGKNHTIAIDSEKRVFSFGSGECGRLGHNEQNDEMVPRLINYLNIMETGGATRAFCGSMFSVVIGLHNNPYFFGKNKVRTDGQLHPKVVDDLCGFNIKSIGCSNTSMVMSCDKGKLIAWGASPTHGELGIGMAPKSSATPIYVESMNGVNVSQVSMGAEHTLLLANPNDIIINHYYNLFPEFIPTV